MRKYFNVNIELDAEKADLLIEDAIRNGGQGYVCCIESNNLTVANKDKAFNSIVNNALVNICDGSVIASILGKIYKQSYHSYTGSDIFKKYIEKKTYKHYFLGNTDEVLEGLKSNLQKVDSKIGSMIFKGLPFCAINDFDYKLIAEDININKPDLIWVSLGAPKQEIFMSKLLPHLDRGVMLGVGAAFNFNAGIGHVKRAPLWMRQCKLEWLYRAFEEPKKNVPRYSNFIKILPSLILKEMKVKAKASKYE